MRPNFARIDTALRYKTVGETAWHATPGFHTDASDGHTAWRVYPADHAFDRSGAAADGHDIRLYDLGPLDGFFNPEEFLLGKIKPLQEEGLLRSLAPGAAGKIRAAFAGYDGNDDKRLEDAVAAAEAPRFF